MMVQATTVVAFRTCVGCLDIYFNPIITKQTKLLWHLLNVPTVVRWFHRVLRSARAVAVRNQRLWRVRQLRTRQQPMIRQYHPMHLNIHLQQSLLLHLKKSLVAVAR